MKQFEEGEEEVQRRIRHDKCDECCTSQVLRVDLLTPVIISAFNSYWRMSRVFCLLDFLLRSFCRLADVRRLSLLDMRRTCRLVLIVIVFVFVIIIPVVGF
jgi:hypothetical protein